MNPNSDPKKSFKVAVSDTENVDIQIHVSKVRAQGLDLTPWASTYVLANLLYKLDIPIPNGSEASLPILELGAGIGLVGMVASILWKRRVYLTELAPIVPGLQHNIVLNEDLLQQYGASANAGALDWEHPQTLTLHDGTQFAMNSNKAVVIIAADTIYDDNHPGILADSILKWLLKTADARVILTYPLRVAYLEQLRELWELLEQGGLEAIEEGKEEAEGDNWDDEKLCEWSVWRWKHLP